MIPTGLVAPFKGLALFSIQQTALSIFLCLSFFGFLLLIRLGLELGFRLGVRVGVGLGLVTYSHLTPFHLPKMMDGK